VRFPRPGVRWRRPDARLERPVELPERPFAYRTRPDAGIGRVRTRLRSPRRRPEGRFGEEIERRSKRNRIKDVQETGTAVGVPDLRSRTPVRRLRPDASDRRPDAYVRRTDASDVGTDASVRFLPPGRAAVGTGGRLGGGAEERLFSPFSRVG
jgi:hypothetical protein